MRPKRMPFLCSFFSNIRFWWDFFLLNKKKCQNKKKSKNILIEPLSYLKSFIKECLFWFWKCGCSVNGSFTFFHLTRVYSSICHSFISTFCYHSHLRNHRICEFWMNSKKYSIKLCHFFYFASSWRNLRVICS